MMKKSLPVYDLVFAVIALAYLIYLFGRAWYIPVTHDEAATSILLNGNNYVKLISYHYGYISANNHVLNSLLAKFCSDITGGLSPLSIRAGNLLAAVAYLAAGYVLLQRFFQTNLLRVIGGVLWLANPYLAEFLALSRGYGMSAALEAATICFGALYLSLPEDAPKRHTYLRLACISAMLVVWANFATLYFFLCFFVLLGWEMLRTRATSRRDLKTLLRSVLVLALLIVLPLIRIKSAGDFSWFGYAGFFKDTVQGFADCFLLGRHYFGPDTLLYLQWLLILLFIASALATLTLWWRSGGKVTPAVWLLGLFPGTVVVNVLATLVTDSSWLSTRTTLFFYPLVVCSVLGLFRLLEKRRPRLAWGLALPAAVLLSVHFFMNANWAHTYEWRYDRDTYTILNYIEKTYQSENRTTPWSLHTYCLQHPSFQFHTRLSKSRYDRYVEEVRDTGCNIAEPVNKEVEFYYVPLDKSNPFQADYDVVLETSDGQRVLLRKKGSPQ